MHCNFSKPTINPRIFICTKNLFGGTPHIGTCMTCPHYKSTSTTKENFTKSPHCTSRVHCEACRTNRAFQISILKDYIWDGKCPHGFTESKYPLPPKPMTIKNTIMGAVNIASNMRPDTTYPSNSKQITNAMKAAARVTLATIQGKENIASPELQQERLDICILCDLYDQKNDRCKKCGCKGNWKKRLITEHCPIGKW